MTTRLRAQLEVSTSYEESPATQQDGTTSTTDEDRLSTKDTLDYGYKQISNTASNEIVTVRLWSSSSSTVETPVSVLKPTDFNIISTVLPTTVFVLVLIVAVVLFIYFHTMRNKYCYKCHKKQRQYQSGSPVTETHRFDMIEMESL